MDFSDDFEDFEDDFVDDSEENEETENESHELLTKTQKLLHDDENDTNSEQDNEPPVENEEQAESADPDADEESQVLPKEDMNDIFNRTEKLDTLSMSLKIANSVTNRLYSLLYSINHDCQVLITRNRTNSPISLQTEAMKQNNPSIKFESGSICHKKFPDNFNCQLLQSEKDKTALFDYLTLCHDVISQALPPIVDSACQTLKDPLVRQHNINQTLKQKINDLKKVNKELSVQTRHTANRLVKLEKSEQPSLEPTTTKSDVIIQQQRLQKVLTRVYNLRESNEATAASNAELQDRLQQESGRLPKQATKVSDKLQNLQKRINEMTASIEQSEEDRETALAKRRVSVNRMNTSIDKIKSEISQFENLLTELDAKVRIMTQGNQDAKSTTSSSSQSDKKPTRQVKPAPGSKIPFRSQQKPK